MPNMRGPRATVLTYYMYCTCHRDVVLRRPATRVGRRRRAKLLLH